MSNPLLAARPLAWSDLASLLTIALLAAVAGAAVTSPMAWSYDSGTYALVSQELVAGRGFSTRIVEPEHSKAAASQPQLTKAPLYPATLAALGGLSLARRWPARAVNVAAHTLTAAGIFCLARLFGGAIPALSAGLIAALGFPGLYVAHWIWTESLFIALSVLFLCSIVAVRRGLGGASMLILSGALACLVLATRQAGLFVLPILARELWALWRRTPRRPLFDAVAMLGPSAVLLAAIAARNLRLAGSVSGIHRPDQQRTLGEVVTASARSIGDLLSVPGWGPATPWVLAASALGLLLFVARGVVAKERARWPQGGFDQLPIALGGYTLVIGLGLLRYQPQYEPRFFVPWIELAVPLVAIAIPQGWRLGSTSTLRRLGAAVGTTTLAALVVASIAGSLRRWPAELETTGIERSPAVATATFAWARQHLRPGDLVASNQPMELALNLDLSVVALPEREWNPKEELPSDPERWLRDRLVSGGGRYLVLIVGPGGLSERAWGAYAAALARRETPGDLLRKIWQSPDGVVYQLTGS